MKIIEHTMEYDYRNFLRIEAVNNSGEVIGKLEFIDGEPEDNNLCRGFNDCYGIAEFCKLVAGGSVQMERVEHEDWESWED